MYELHMRFARINATHGRHCFNLNFNCLSLQLSRLVPRTFSVIQHVLTQKYAGHITIVPDASVAELLSFFHNPSEDMCQHAIVEGERATYRRMWPSRVFTVLRLRGYFFYSDQRGQW